MKKVSIYRCKVAVKDCQDCYSIILNVSFEILFSFCKSSLEKRLLKFDQELLGSWKKVTIHAIVYQRTRRILRAKFR